ncbi:MAG: hypothetical protein KZQ91_20580 [Candidatus Thiodiazotropha sp. (ex Lucinoma borealis)]|nr:hypothetical protein [Candidatus Thiodiazotropha sp. (ex Lucinoma borealis)]
MKFTICLILLLLPLATYGKCLYLPSHTFDLAVAQCNQVKIGPGALRSKDGSFLDMQGDTLNGAIISGIVTNVKYDWEGNPIRSSFAEWANGSFQSVFIPGENMSLCKGQQNFMLSLRTTWPCCDTYPQPAFCFVPQTIPIVVIQIEK